MSTPTWTVPAEPAPETFQMLREAVSEIRSYPNDTIMSSRFQCAHEVTDYLEQLIDHFVAGDTAAGRELYTAFLATGDWDDACGSHALGNRLCEAMRPYYRGAR